MYCFKVLLLLFVLLCHDIICDVINFCVCVILISEKLAASDTHILMFDYTKWFWAKADQTQFGITIMPLSSCVGWWPTLNTRLSALRLVFVIIHFWVQIIILRDQTYRYVVFIHLDIFLFFYYIRLNILIDFVVLIPLTLDIYFVIHIIFSVIQTSTFKWSICFTHRSIVLNI